MNTLRNHVIEEHYLGVTRLVIGPGYEVKDVLFPQEYTTLRIRKLPRDVSKDDLLNLINRMNKDGKEIVRTIELVDLETTCLAKITFFSKMDAKTSFEHLKGETIKGKLIDVVPSDVGPNCKREISQRESGRLKISWPIGYSIGKAYISFTTPRDANACIDRINFLFPNSRISQVHGELRDHLTFRGSRNNINERIRKKPLPPARLYDRVFGAARFSQGNIRFIEEPGHSDFEYKITIDSINLCIDEHEIISRVRPAVPKWVKVFRVAGSLTKADAENGLPEEDLARKLHPIKDFIEKDTLKTYFFDINLCRAVITVHFKDELSLHRAYRSSDFSVLGDVCLQPHRLEIEYTHSTTLHIDLYKFLEKDIEKIRNTSLQQGVTTSKPNNHIDSQFRQFVTLSFRSCHANLIKQIQSQFDELPNCTKFVCEKIELLFTWTGKHKLEELADKTFLHWINQTRAIWIYGKPEVQKQVAEELGQVVNSLMEYEIFDKPFMLNKRKINLNGNQNDRLKISRICDASSLAYYHFNGNKLYASGSLDAVAKIEEVLEQNQFLFKRLPTKLASIHNGRLSCLLCFCQPEGAFILTSLCGHTFCIECIQPMFNMQPPEFPIKCPECQTFLVISDILKCAPQASLRKFLEVGVFKFQEQNFAEILICPKPGCNQLLSYLARRRGQFGGDFYLCDECDTTYCMT
ncbi:unnamed protein product [Allacma fusca]|uniref:RING-type domain-containing protein n=1 Tax=Allacma fusca TaxID=39272 RepID=A0A8J2LIT2_9HEXA|nr:unnamed protein product [Allacma fusca]